MVWNLFGGGKKKQEDKAKLRKKGAAVPNMPPIMAPGESAEPPPQKAEAESRLDHMTIVAAIESAKRELASRDRAIDSSVRSQAARGKLDPSEDPADAAARKKQLIQAAMTVHKLKQSTFDGLDPGQRQQLRNMAENALGVDAKRKK